MRQAAQDGRLARTLSTRNMALWVLVVLLGYLLLYYA
jgi:multicomponent Na+:H+ antiporter subunit D